jgi:D-sedoheptulose 7-phosphate isomerase
MQNWIREKIKASQAVKEQLLQDGKVLETLSDMITEGVRCFKNGGKALFCGNGGSAADAQHLAAELTGRFYKDRRPLDAEALHVNTSFLTAVGNDYSYEEIYSRLIEAKGCKGDLLIGLSTSGTSPNVLRALQKAQSLGMITIGLTGESGGQMKDCCHYLLKVPSQDTPRIQEAHILLGHIFCEAIERKLFA